jgi:hypothetical protein
MAPAAEDNSALLARSIVGWFSRQPELGSAGGLVAPPVFHLVLAAARALSVGQHGDAQHDSTPATIVDGPGVVG